VECKESLWGSSLAAVTRELSKYKLDLFVAQVRLERGGIEAAGDFTFLFGNGSRNHDSKTELFIHILLGIQRADFINERIHYLIQRGNWCKVIALNVHTSVEYKTGDKKGEPQRVFSQFPNYDTNISLGDFNAKIGKEDTRIFKPKIWNVSN
jgi:hypothetical protein